jgi:hypothetical protein
MVDDAKLGQYLVRTRRVTPSTIERALEIQQDLPFLRLGEILLGLRAIDFKDLIEALYSQFSENLLGQILVRRRVTTFDRIQEALDIQSGESQQRRLGEILVDMGEATPAQIAEALTEREMYNEFKFRLGFNRYFDELSGTPDRGAVAIHSDPPPGWANEVAALDDESGPRWTPGG